MNRRTFVKTTVMGAVSLTASAQSNNTPGIVDTHTHFYDPDRPEGIPWPPKNSPLYKKVMPADFEKVSAPFGVRGTVVVEASSKLEDNQWILDLAKENSNILAYVGNVDPLIDDWEKHIKRFAKDKIFRGIRLKKSMEKLDDKTLLNKFRLISDLDLTVDVQGGAKALLAAEKLSKAIPALRIVVEHLPGRAVVKPDRIYDAALKKIKSRPNVFAKVSSVLTQVNKKTVTDPAHYKKHLDQLWAAFGEDRLIFGSNWPVSDIYNGTYGEVFKVVDSYFSAKGTGARAKYFGGNALKAYKWAKS